MGVATQPFNSESLFVATAGQLPVCGKVLYFIAVT